MPFETTAMWAGTGEHLGSQPLIATDDAELLDDLLRLAAAAGVDAQVATTVDALRARWSRQSMVLLGADMAHELQTGFVPRRDGVILTGRESSATSDLWQAAASLGAEQVALLPIGEPWLVDRISAAGTAGIRPALTIAVIGACGGAGATSLTIGLAHAATRRGKTTVVMDLDPFGAGIEVLLGDGIEEGLGWRDFDKARGRLRGNTLVPALSQAHDIAVVGWTGAVAGVLEPGAVGSVIDAVALSSDIVVVDLPRALGRSAAEALCRVDELVVITPKSSVAAVACGRLLAAPELREVPTGLVVRGPSAGPVTGGQIAEALHIPLLCEMPGDSAVARRIEQGRIPARDRGALATASRSILDQLFDSFAATNRSNAAKESTS